MCITFDCFFCEDNSEPLDEHRAFRKKIVSCMWAIFEWRVFEFMSCLCEWRYLIKLLLYLLFTSTDSM